MFIHDSTIKLILIEKTSLERMFKLVFAECLNEVFGTKKMLDLNY